MAKKSLSQHGRIPENMSPKVKGLSISGVSAQLYSSERGEVLFLKEIVIFILILDNPLNQRNERDQFPSARPPEAPFSTSKAPS